MNTDVSVPLLSVKGIGLSWRNLCNLGITFVIKASVVMGGNCMQGSGGGGGQGRGGVEGWKLPQKKHIFLPQKNCDY